MLDDKTAIVFSAHRGTKKENIGDMLGAVALSKISGLPNAKLFCLPIDEGRSANVPVIYGGGGMIRPLFYDKINQDFRLRDKNLPYFIYGVGLNVDVGGKQFRSVDLVALGRWLANAESITVRENTSMAFVQEKFGLQVNSAPCPTYSYLRKRRTQNKNKYSLGIVPSTGHTEAYLKFRSGIMSVIDDMVSIIDISNVCFICHDRQDYETMTAVYGSRTKAVFSPKSLEEVNQIYSFCDGIFSLRGHGIIFAAATGRPCSYIPLNVKLNALYEFHYGQPYRDVVFSADFHILEISKKILPLEKTLDFKL